MISIQIPIFKYRRLFRISEPDGVCKNGCTGSGAQREKQSGHKSLPAAAGQLSYIRITWPFLMLQQIDTDVNGLLNQGRVFFLCSLHMTLSFNICDEFLISLNMGLT